MKHQQKKKGIGSSVMKMIRGAKKEGDEDDIERHVCEWVASLPPANRSPFTQTARLDLIHWIVFDTETLSWRHSFFDG